MESVVFEVGAKAARLIGRENVASVDGALIELIKNSYDADASCVCVYFDMPFPFIPESISPDFAIKVLSTNDLESIAEYYERSKGGEYLKKKDLSDEAINKLRKILAPYNRIIVADNGHGMNYNDVKTKWMYIGTSNKEIHSKSPKGRVKTGAKGIGRFAMDKLSLQSTMITQKKSAKAISWNLNWEQFDNALLLSQVSARINFENESYKQHVEKILENKFPQEFYKYRWESGTMIVLSSIREDWSLRLFEKVNTSLQSINPLGTADPFRVFIKNKFYPTYDFETAEVAISKKDYDYKISMVFDGKTYLKVSLTRNEVDIDKESILIKEFNRRVDLSPFWDRPYFNRENYRRKQFASIIENEINITERLEDDPAKIRNVGPFEAELYFGKSVKSSEVTIQNPPCLLQDDFSISGKSSSQCLVCADTMLSACTDI